MILSFSHFISHMATDGCAQSGCRSAQSMSGSTADTSPARDPRLFAVPQQTPLTSPFRGMLQQQHVHLKQHHARICVRESKPLITFWCCAAGMDINDSIPSQGPEAGSDMGVSPTTSAQDSGLQPASSNGPPNLPPLALDVRLPPLHPKQASQLYLLAIGHGSLFAGKPRSITILAPILAMLQSCLPTMCLHRQMHFP